MARQCDVVIASRYCALDHDTAFRFFRIFVLPAWQIVNVMSAGQCDIDVGNLDIALFVALAAALILAVVIATCFHPTAWLGAINSLVETIRVALVDAGVSTWEPLSTQKVASGLR